MPGRSLSDEVEARCGHVVSDVGEPVERAGESDRFQSEFYLIMRVDEPQCPFSYGEAGLCLYDFFK